MPSVWGFFLCPSYWHNSKEETFEFSAMANCCLFRIFSYVTLIYHLRLTFKIIFSALNVELKPEMDSDDYLQISKLQKPINCLAVWANCSRLCLPMLFFCRKAKPTRLFWLTCFYSFLVCFYSCGFAKLLHPVLN